MPLAKVTFPKGFSTSVEKKKHYNNTEEVTKRIEEIVILYFNEEGQMLRKSNEFTVIRYGTFFEVRKKNTIMTLGR